MFDLHREQVEGMVAEGESLVEVEHAIAGAGLPSEHRDALWLFAWALRGRRASRFRFDGARRRPADRLVPVRGEA